MIELYIYTVKPVLRGHPWDKEKVSFKDRWPLKRGSIHITFSMTGQEKCDLLIPRKKIKNKKYKIK